MFVTFEGLDGSGKTTQVDRLRARLEAEGREVVATREPGGTPLGEGIRELVLHGHEMSPWAEALLFASARAEHVEEVIRPALERGADVLCDRYVDSSLAYQGIARGLGLERVLEVNLDAVGGLMPDRTFVLALDSETASGRVGESPDRIEREERRLPRPRRGRLPRARRALPGADRRARRLASRRQARREDPWSPSQRCLSSRTRSAC